MYHSVTLDLTNKNIPPHHTKHFLHGPKSCGPLNGAIKPLQSHQCYLDCWGHKAKMIFLNRAFLKYPAVGNIRKSKGDKKSVRKPEK